MKKYVPIVTDDPQDNVEAALNLVFIRTKRFTSAAMGRRLTSQTRP